MARHEQKPLKQVIAYALQRHSSRSFVNIGSHASNAAPPSMHIMKNSLQHVMIRSMLNVAAQVSKRVRLSSRCPSREAAVSGEGGEHTFHKEPL